MKDRHAFVGPARAGLLVLVATALVGLSIYHALDTESLAEEPGAKKPSDSPGGLPPLVIDKSAPLLLDEPPAKAKESQAFLIINDACYVCHNNYREEPLAVIHAKEETGCADCHGDSLDHRNDEDNITPPEIMYPLAKIDEACRECHDSHNVPAREVLTRWQERCPQKTDFSTVVCTDCHGFHRLERRVVRWNKETGELIVRPTKVKTPSPGQ
jgi:hypothetical protein